MIRRRSAACNLCRWRSINCLLIENEFTIMSERFWEKLSQVIGYLAIGVIFGMVVFAANIEIKDLDLWLHLKMGEYIVAHGYVPDRDVLSCTIAGKPWINHEWLFQVIVYLIFSHQGAQGLISMQAAIVLATLLILLFLGYQRERQLGVIFTLLLVTLVYQLRFTTRPDLFSLFFFAGYIYVLAIHLNKRWALYAVFIIQALWSNFHGFFFLGPFIILVGIISESLKRHAKLPWEWSQGGRLTDDEFKRLKHLFIVAVLASLVNPMAVKGALYPIGVLANIAGESKIFFKYIQELQPPIQWNDLMTSRYAYYKILIFISFLGFVFNRRKMDIGDFLIWCTFLYISLVAVRNMVFFAFVAYLVCMTNFSNISMADICPLRFVEKKFQHITSVFAKILLILWVFQYATAISGRSYFDFDKYEMKSEYGGITQRNYPVKAADFIVQNGIRGNFFNDFNSGAYLIGRTSPQIKVFIDGRTEVYGADFFKFYRNIWEEQKGELFDSAAEQYHLTGVFLNSTRVAIPENLLRHVYNDKKWVPVYFDYDGMIFLKDIPENKAWIDKLRINLSDWQAKTMDLKRLGPRRVGPYQHISRAYTLEALDFDEAALAEAGHALEIMPGYLDGYKIIGKIYGKKNDYEKAFENFRKAVMISPFDMQNRLNLGLAYEKLSEYQYAIKQYTAMTNYEPKNPQGYYLLARALIGDGQQEKAFEVISSAYKLNMGAVKDMVGVGDIFYDHEKFDLALKTYTLALGAKKDMALVYGKTGLCYSKLGEKQKAKEQFEQGFKIEPDNPDLQKYLKGL